MRITMRTFRLIVSGSISIITPIYLILWFFRERQIEEPLTRKITSEMFLSLIVVIGFSHFLSFRKELKKGGRHTKRKD